MARLTKKDLQKQVTELEKENESLKQQIKTLVAKVNFYENVQKQLSDTCAGGVKFLSDCMIGWNLGNKEQSK
ncbi:Uncharacterised protein [uncultured archaeon]|nr:Uncharacterised protein [uncultured archaeon]